MKKILICFILYTYPAIAMAQNTGNIAGKILDPSGKPMAFVTVLLLNAADSSLTKGAISDNEGKYLFQNIKYGNYFVKAKMVGFQDTQSRVFELTAENDSIHLKDFVMEEDVQTMKEVVVEAQRPMIEQFFDKTVLNVEGSITSTGSTTLEVLEKAPGVVVDRNDNISMQGRSGVLVMIDGKLVPMSGQELANTLRGLPANSVDKIELITNPSAKYDAAGNAGIINIKLKKDKSLGTNGTFSSSFGQGIYPKLNQGIQLNNRNKKINLFGNYNFMYRKEFTFLDLYRQFYEGEAYVGAYDQQNRFYYSSRTHNARIGLDYYITPKTVIGIVANGIANKFHRDNTNKSSVLNSLEQPESLFLTDGESNNKRSNGGINVNLKHTFDSTGRELSSDLDYIVYRNLDSQNYLTTYYNLANELTQSPYVLYGDLNGILSIKSAKIDYSQPLKSIDATLEAGIKSSLVNADNNLQFFNRSNGGNVLDNNISNHFLYKENINAAYLNASKRWKKINLQLGLRLENTNADGKQLTDGQEFKRNYTQLFPSGFVGYTINKKHEIGLSLSRRIDRPTYNQLNPFKSFLDPSTYSAGNPFLRPELTYSFEFTHTFNQKIITKYSYSHTNDIIIVVLSPDPNQEKVITQTSLNLATFDYHGITLSIPVSLGKWFNSTNNITAYYGLYRGNLANTDLNNGRPSFTINSNNTFTLPNDWSAEIIGVYRSREIYGFLDVQPIRFLSAGIQKKLWDKKATLKLNVADVFYSDKAKATTALTGYKEKFFQRRDSRVITFSLTYKFGGNQVAPSRRQTGGAEEEKSRAN